MALVNVKRIDLIVMEEEGEDYEFLDVVRILYNKNIKKSQLNFLILTRLESEKIVAWNQLFPGSHILNRRVTGDELKKYIVDIKHEFKKPLLSPREWQVLNFLCSGISQTQASKILAISPKTFSAHKKNLSKKLQCKDSKSLNKLIISMIKTDPHSLQVI